ncbi:MAG TPA: hypothetical protein VN688_22030 [Gemmataceae bacterium]|nr:hypothetical protein [Gemmataceae bacterium]
MPRHAADDAEANPHVSKVRHAFALADKVDYAFVAFYGHVYCYDLRK